MSGALPEAGTPWEALADQLAEARNQDADWRGGRVPLYVHFAGDDVLEVAKRAYEMYFSENGLGPRAFKSLARMEREVVDIGLALMRAPAGACGAMTTGGTESIFLAVKAAREYRVSVRGGLRGTPRLVVPRSAHPAFDKAAFFMGIDVVRTPLMNDFRADPDAIAAAIDENTIMVVASAPAFPHGVVDPVTEIAGNAARHGVWCHVDACVGGYFAPFAAQLGVALPAWDLSVPGVCTISADLHKYGYTAKGASTLFFRDEATFSKMGWAFDDWPRGRYFTNTLVGTRPGGAIAAAWAVLRYLGASGYRRIAQRVLDTRRALQAGVVRQGFQVFGDPPLSIISYGGDTYDLEGITGELEARGWLVARTQQPNGFHHMLNLSHEPVIGQYLDDLESAIIGARSSTAQPPRAGSASY